MTPETQIATDATSHAVLNLILLASFVGLGLVLLDALGAFVVEKLGGDAGRKWWQL